MTVSVLFIIGFMVVMFSMSSGNLSAKIYRAGVLMYGTTPKIKNIVKTVWKA